MNKHMRLVASALFIVIILLAVAITRFYSSTSESTGSGSAQPAVEKKLGTDSSGNRIFEDSTGLYGIVDSSDKIIVLPEWQELDFADFGICTAAKQIKGKKMFGCIDYEGNVTVPFIYSYIERHMMNGYVFYAAKSQADSSVVIYDERFVPCFTRAWSGFSVSGSDIKLNTETGSYICSVNEEGFDIKNAAVSGEILGCEYELNVTSRILLSKLNISMLERISDGVGRYMEYAYTDSAECLSGMRHSGIMSFSVLFPEDDRILERNLMNISDMFIYSVKSNDDKPHYMVQITADTEIVYTDENGKTNTLREDYKAMVEFSGETADELMAASGKFRQEEPNYPVPEPDTEPPADENGNIIPHPENEDNKENNQIA